MKTYGNVEIEGGGEIINADIDNGTADPTGTGPGELFYRSDLNQLRVYNGSTWASILTSASDVTSILGTTNQITASPTTGNVTLAFAPNIAIPAPASGNTLTIGVASGSAGAVINSNAGDYALLVNDGTQELGILTQVGSVQVGSVTNSALYLYTAGTNRLEIANTGAVTINATSSGTTLFVNGPATFYSNVGFENTAPATSTANSVGSYSLAFQSNYWDGTISQTDTWSLFSTLGTGTNPSSTMYISHIGTSGSSALAVPYIIGSSGAQFAGNVSIDGGLVFTQANEPSPAMIAMTTTTANSGPQIYFSGANGVGYIGVDAFNNSTFTMGSTSANPLPVEFVTAGGVRQSISTAGNVSIAEPVSGTAFTVTGSSSIQNVAQFLSTSSATTAATDVLIQRAAGTANAHAEGANLSLWNYTPSDGTTIQNSGGQTEIWQSNSSVWHQLAFWNSNQALTLNAPTTGATVTANTLATSAAFEFTDGTHIGQLFLGSATGMEVQFGAYSNHGIQLFTNNATRMWINNTGNATFNAASSGNTVNINGSSSGSALSVISGLGASQGGSDIYIQRAGSTANQVGAGPTLQLQDVTNNVATIIQNSGGQTEIWQYNGGWNRMAFWDTLHGFHISSETYFGSIVSFTTNQWNVSSDGQKRLYFTSGGDTYYEAGGGYHHFRNQSDADVLTIDMSGNLVAAGNVTAGSDIALKTEIEPIDNALEKVEQLTGVTFRYKDQETRSTGLIAQDVEKVLPEAVGVSSTGFKTLAYGNIVGLLVEAIKDLKEEIEELKKKIP